MVLCDPTRRSALSGILSTCDISRKPHRRSSHWSMRHRPEGAVLASYQERGVRPRLSWLLEEPSRRRIVLLLLLLLLRDSTAWGRKATCDDCDGCDLGCFSGFVPLVNVVSSCILEVSRCFTSFMSTLALPSPSTSSWHCKGNLLSICI